MVWYSTVRYGTEVSRSTNTVLNTIQDFVLCIVHLSNCTRITYHVTITITITITITVSIAIAIAIAITITITKAFRKESHAYQQEPLRLCITYLAVLV